MLSHSKQKPRVRNKVSTRQLRSTSTTTTKKPHISLRKKRWAVTWGQSDTNGLGRKTDMLFDPHPQRVLLPSLLGDYYTPYQEDVIVPIDIPENGLADVVQVAAGWSTNLALTSEGRVFQWGFRKPTRAMIKRVELNNKLGQQVNNFFQNVVGYHPWSGGSPLPRRIPLFGAINDIQLQDEAQRAGVQLPPWINSTRMQPIKIATSADNRGVLTSGGHLFTWSDSGDGYGSIGHGREYSTTSIPKMIPIPDIVDFSFGYNHLSFVTAHGTLYSCGNTDSGATGLPLAFLALESKKKRVFRPLSVHTNYEHFINDLKDAFRQHKASYGDQIKRLATNLPPDQDKQLTELHNDTAYKIQTGKTYEKIDLSQFEISSPGLPSIHIGGTREVDSHQAMRLTDATLLSVISQRVNFKGVEGKEGAIDPINQFVLGLLPTTLPKFKSVSSGFAHTLALDEHGDVWSYGRNAHGELGHVLDPLSNEGRGDLKSHHSVNAGLTPVDFRQYYYPTKILSLSQLGVKVSKVSAGLHHSAILSTNGEVYTFGNNEYGQCGRLNELPSTLKSLNIGHKQPWSLPPGRLHISANVLNGAKIIDVSCGFYDTMLTLSDGRCLITGSYLSKSQPHNLFSLSEFDPLFYDDDGDGDDDDNIESEKKNGPGTWIQSIPSRDLIPRSLYAKLHKEELENIKKGIRSEFTSLSDEAYFMTSIAVGWHHCVATAIPRTYADAPPSSFLSSTTSNSTSHEQSSQQTIINNDDSTQFVQFQSLNDNTTLQIDPTLLFSQEAANHHEDADNSYQTSAIDNPSDVNPFKKL